MIARPSHPPPVSPPRAREKQAVRNAGRPSNGGILRPLGFYGLDGIEVSIVAGLVTGDPVLLVGGERLVHLVAFPKDRWRRPEDPRRRLRRTAWFP